MAVVCWSDSFLSPMVVKVTMTNLQCLLAMTETSSVRKVQNQPSLCVNLINVAVNS